MRHSLAIRLVLVCTIFVIALLALFWCGARDRRPVAADRDAASGTGETNAPPVLSGAAREANPDLITAAEPAQAPGEDNDGGTRSEIHGRVEDDQTDLAVSGAVVYEIRPSDGLVSAERSTRSGEDGEFRLPSNTANGTRTLAILAQGYLPWTGATNSSETPLIARLVRGLSIGGRVVDVEGRGIEGAHVSASADVRAGTWPSEPDWLADPRWVSGAWATSGFDGAFLIEGLSRDREYYVRGSKQGYCMDEGMVPPTASGGRSDVLVPMVAIRRVSVQVKDGTTEELLSVGEIRILPSGLRVLGPLQTGEPVSQLALDATFKKRELVMDVSVVRPPGIIRVMASRWGYEDLDETFTFGNDADQVLTVIQRRLAGIAWHKVRPRAQFRDGEAVVPFTGTLALGLWPQGVEGAARRMTEVVVDFEAGVAGTPVTIPAGVYAVSMRPIGPFGEQGAPSLVNSETTWRIGASAPECALELSGNPVAVSLTSYAGISIPAFRVDIGKGPAAKRHVYWAVRTAALWRIWLPRGKHLVEARARGKRTGHTVVNSSGDGKLIELSLHLPGP